MPPALRPATVEALQEFRRRRSQLLWVRAGCAALGVLLALLLLVALLDRVTFMPDGFRQGLGYTVYAGALLAAWRVGLRHLRDARGSERAAQLLEQADPSLREQVLSAVELSKRPHDAFAGSEEFRGRLQDDVASQLAGFDAKKLLPSSLLKRAALGLAGIAALVTGLTFVPPLHLPGFMARAALPFANLARPSSTRIVILAPEKPDALAAIASSFPFTVQIEGQPAKRVVIETRSDENRPVRVELLSAGSGRYEGAVNVGQENVRYRIFAGDAVTAWHTLEARPRPRVTEFVKTVVPPAYSGLPETAVTEDQGDLAALEGSTVKLTLKTNQPVERAAGTIFPSTSTLPVKVEQPDLLRLSVPLDGRSDSWQLALTARETGFTNDEASPWRIETVADLPPIASITQPNEQIEVRNDDTVSVAGEASDDIGLARIEMAYAINGADWTTKALAEKSGKEADVSTTLKLAPLPVKTGDAVLVKLIATDLKGQTSESQPVRLLIVESRLNLAKREWAAKEHQLAEQADALAAQTHALRKDAEHAKAMAKNSPKRNRDEAEAEAALSKLKQDLKTSQERADDLWNQMKETARQAPDRLASQEINLAGRQLAELRGDHLREALQQAHAEQTDQKQLRESVNQTAGKAQALADALRAFAAEQTAEAVRENLEHLAPQQNRLADRAIDANRDPEARPKWQEQQRAALASTEKAREDLQSLKEVIHEPRRRDVDSHVQNLDRRIPGLQDALDKPAQHQAPEFVYGQAHEMRHALNQARDASRWMASETAQRAADIRDRLAKQPNPALAALDQARALADRAASQKRDKSNVEPAKDQAADKLAAAARGLKDQSELREQHPQTNTQAALDQNRLGRALDHLAQQMRHDASPEEIRGTSEKAANLALAARALQADAAAQDAARALDDIKQSALAQDDPAEAVADAKAALTDLKQLPNQLRQAQADNEAANAAQLAAGQVQSLREQLQSQADGNAQQRQNGETPAALSPDKNPAMATQAEAEKALANAMEKFAANVAGARETLSRLTPKLSELAKNAANELGQSSDQTKSVAQAARENQPAEQTAQQAEALTPRAKEDAGQLADLQSALRQEADHADMKSEAERQMARTADVGLAQMRQQTPQIEENIEQAAKPGATAPQQAQSLDSAAQAQRQTADALNQLAQNLAKMEQGQALPQDALAAQQAMEEALGIKQPLDQSYQEAKDLAQLMEQAEENPQAALAALEQELKRNAQMQRALGNIAEQTAMESQSQLSVAQIQPELAPELQENGAHELARVARHELRLDQQEAARQAADASKKIQQTAQAAKKDPAQNTRQSAEQAAQVAQQAHNAAAEAAREKAANTPAPSSFFDGPKGAMLAQALDQLDQSLNPLMSQQDGEQQQDRKGQQQPGQKQQQQQGKPQSSQQDAQKSLAQANEAQAQSMAQSRAQGMVPGQKTQQQAKNQQGQQQQKGEGKNQESPDAAGNMASSTFANMLVPSLDGTKGGDWGHLPSRMAKDLTEASRQEPSPEYRAAIESYYKAIAEKAKR
jgi:hypothetical protein